MGETVRIGILGGGGILGAHAPGFRAAADVCTVVAVAEPNPDQAERIHQLLGSDVAIEKDYHDVLARDDVDAVDILLPHDLHMPATVAAAEAGKPVLTEKVMARNIHECDRMIEACDAAGVSLTICHDRRYHGDWIVLKQIVDSGVLGEIYHWKLQHTQNVAPRRPGAPASWIADYDRLGGGAIMSCLTHQIDALRWYGGEVDSVACMRKTVPERMDGESVGVVLAQMASGALAELSISWITRSNTAADGLWYELNHVTGSLGEAYFSAGKGTYLLTYEEPAVELPVGFEGEARKAGQSFRKVRSDGSSGHVNCIREWINSLLGRPAHITTTGRDVRGTVEVAEAAYRAADTGRTVILPIEPEPWRDS